MCVCVYVYVCVCARETEREFIAYKFSVVFFKVGLQTGYIACTGLLWLHDYDHKKKNNKQHKPRSPELFPLHRYKTVQPPATDNSNNCGKLTFTHVFITLWTHCFLFAASHKCLCCSLWVCFEGFPSLWSVSRYKSHLQSSCCIFRGAVCGKAFEMLRSFK